MTDDQEVCPHCGSPAGELFRCERCGTGYDDADACPACGKVRVPAACERHPDRAAHSRCVICGSPVCAECSDPDRPTALCPDHSDVTVIEGWAQVYSTTGEVEGQMLVENLRAEGLDAQLYSQSDRTFPVDMGELSIVRVLVPVWEYAQALELIRDYMDTGGEVAFACPSCGEVYEPGATTCTSCGAALSA
jgi:hypothetical protein